MSGYRQAFPARGVAPPALAIPGNDPDGRKYRHFAQFGEFPELVSEALQRSLATSDLRLWACSTNPQQHPTARLKLYTAGPTSRGVTLCPGPGP